MEWKENERTAGLQIDRNKKKIDVCMEYDHQRQRQTENDKNCKLQRRRERAGGEGMNEAVN